MRPIKAIVLYVAGVIFLGALFAPWLYWLAQWLSHQIPATQKFGEDFGRVADRAFLIVGAAGLWPLLRSLGVRSWSGLGWTSNGAWWRASLGGWFIGIASLGIVAAVMTLAATRVLDHAYWARDFPSYLPRVVLTGVVVALIEETFFRGGIQGALQRTLNFPAALMTGSAVYSIVHFIKPSRADMSGATGVDWLSGFDCLGQAIARSAGEPGVLIGFGTLFLAGCVLGLAFVRTKALYLPMGIHAGWIFTLKSYTHFTTANRDAGAFARWIGSGPLIESFVSWPVLGLVIILLWRWRRNSDSVAESEKGEVS